MGSKTRRSRSKLPKFLAKYKYEPVLGAKETDIIIPIMGPTGAGKSTFIDVIAKPEKVGVGHSLKSTTEDIKHHIIVNPRDKSRRIILVDTPGFDDTYLDDAEVLRRIALWLGRSYNDGMKLAGIIYLHEISQDRVTGTARKNVAMFRQLCGDDALKSVVLATTKWSKVTETVGLEREKELKEIFWKTMTRQGSRMMQYRDNESSAWKIVLSVVDRGTTSIRIQQEIVDLEKYLPETNAGKALYEDLQRLLVRLKEELVQLEAMDAKRDGSDLQEEYQETQKRITDLIAQIKELKVPGLMSKIMCIFSGK